MKISANRPTNRIAPRPAHALPPSAEQLQATLFKQAYLLLPWFCRNCPDFALKLKNFRKELVPLFRALKEDAVPFFGSLSQSEQANRELLRFYELLEPAGNPASNRKAVLSYIKAWKITWLNRQSFQLRLDHVRLMKLFHSVICRRRSKDLPELISMARLVDTQAVDVNALIVLSAKWMAKKEFKQASLETRRLRIELFGAGRIKPAVITAAKIQKPRLYKAYKKAVRKKNGAARLRFIEIFNENRWFHPVDIDILRPIAKKEKLHSYLPRRFRGRVSVQHTGYPLGFYTYAGLKLETPPLYGVKMNTAYNKPFSVNTVKSAAHPLNDRTFYCTSKARLGRSKCKHYTVEYKRRARLMKYQSVKELRKVIDTVRRRLMKHLQSRDRNTWVKALVCLLIDITCARIGNRGSATGRGKTYGLTTLETKKHIRIENNNIIIQYTGKAGQPQMHVLELARGSQSNSSDIRHLVTHRLVELVAESKKYLFTKANGLRLTARQVNEYFTAPPTPAPYTGLPEGGAGSPCTVHNIRNYHATELFNQLAEKIHLAGPNMTYRNVLAAYSLRPSCLRPSRSPALQEQNNAGGILQQVAAKLQNTPAVCRKAYIDPRAQITFFLKYNCWPPDSLLKDLYISDEDLSNLAGIIKSSSQNT